MGEKANQQVDKQYEGKQRNASHSLSYQQNWLHLSYFFPSRVGRQSKPVFQTKHCFPSWTSYQQILQAGHFVFVPEQLNHAAAAFFSNLLSTKPISSHVQSHSRAKLWLSTKGVFLFLKGDTIHLAGISLRKKERKKNREKKSIESLNEIPNCTVFSNNRDTIHFTRIYIFFFSLSLSLKKEK